MSDSTEELLNACKTLNIDAPIFLLMGKKLLHPKFVDMQEFHNLGFAKDHSDLKKIKNLQEKEFNTWLSDISNKLVTECSLRQVKLNRAGVDLSEKSKHAEPPKTKQKIRGQKHEETKHDAPE